MTRAKGNFDFFSSECVVGTALSVDRTYFGGQFACGDGVTLVCNLVRHLRVMNRPLNSRWVVVSLEGVDSRARQR